MLVVQDGIQEILAVYRIPSDLLDPWSFSLFKHHSVKELVTLLNTDVFPHDIIYIVIRIEHFNFQVEQAGFAFYPHKIARFFIEQLAIHINLHVSTFVSLNRYSRNVCIGAVGNDY